MKVIFSEAPPVRIVPDELWDGRTVYVLLGALDCYIVEKGIITLTIHIPAGFKTDFASIPKIFDDVFGFDPRGKYSLPAIVHDFLYSEHGAQSRKRADKIFLVGMADKQVPKHTRYLMYYTVRAFGHNKFVEYTGDDLQPTSTTAKT